MTEYEACRKPACALASARARDRAVADAPDLDYSMAAEILLLIETLEKMPS